MRLRSMSAFSGTAKTALFAFLLFTLVSCARPEGTGRAPADAALVAETWQRFITAAARAGNQAGPFRVNATLYYSGKEDSQRVTVYFWGNGAQSAPLPVRLDILVGPGSVAASAREDSRGIFIYVPRDETVYHAEHGGLLAFDLPVPFSLADLSFLVTGRFAELFIPGDDVPDAITADNGGIAYTLDSAPLPGLLTLGPNGLPRSWTDGTKNGWVLTIDYWPDSTRPTPRKLHIRHGEGREATFIVRDLSFPAPFSPRQLELPVPEGTRLAPLRATR